MSNIKTIRVLGRNPCSLNDGEGSRDVWYIANCTHFCQGCHSEKYWYDNGQEFNIQKVIDKMKENPITDITISGGDGLTIQYKNTLELLKQIKKQTNKNVWLYTGYTFDELINSNKKECLKHIDVLVDSRFEIDKRDITLKFKGSSNQRIIDVQESLKQNKIIKYNFNKIIK
ncbi:anaerobic ribonucleoside-triphosphate reductase activating protein [Clostridium botulinum]|nr:anaerobic ribonucleoside-triphosphate reductase activating protein [Clostridium botulinum]